MNHLFLQLPAFIYVTNVEYNSKYVKVLATTFNDQIHDTKLNLSCQNYVPLANIFWYLEVLLPESATDKNYRRKLFSTTVNLQKLFNGVRGISILSALLDAMRKSASFEFKFPFETVRIIYDHWINKINIINPLFSI